MNIIQNISEEIVEYFNYYYVIIHIVKGRKHIDHQLDCKIDHHSRIRFGISCTKTSTWILYTPVDSV